VVQDLRFTLRQLRKNPAFTVTATMMVALGIGASVAIFAFVDAALIKPLPYRDPSRLLYVTETTPEIPHAAISYADFVDWKRLNTVFDSFDVYNQFGFALSTSAGVEMIDGARVSDGFFRTLGVGPMLGSRFLCRRRSARGAPHFDPHACFLAKAFRWQRRCRRAVDDSG